MSSPLDSWNESTKSTCFRRFAQELKDQSTGVFLRDKHHSEMFFIVTEEGQAAVMPAPPKMDRDEMVEKLKQMIRKENIYGIVHVVEAWTYLPKKPGDHTTKQIMLGEIAVSELQPGDRTEAVVVMMETKDKAHFMWITPILRDGDKVTLGETLAFPEAPGGRFAGLFEP